MGRQARHTVRAAQSGGTAPAVPPLAEYPPAMMALAERFRRASTRIHEASGLPLVDPVWEEIRGELRPLVPEIVRLQALAYSALVWHTDTRSGRLALKVHEWTGCAAELVDMLDLVGFDWRSKDEELKARCVDVFRSDAERDDWICSNLDAYARQATELAGAVFDCLLPEE